MNKFIFYIFGSFFVLFLSCRNKESTNNSIQTDIVSYLKVSENENYSVLVITESDCSACFENVSKIRMINGQNVVGLYYANDSKAFFKTLKKINPIIEWVALKDRILPRKIEKLKKKVGPFLITKSNDDFIIEKFL